jgi:hypothetical protein
MQSRLATLSALALALLFPGAEAAAQNLALNRPATGSTACNANEGPAKAVNGSVSGSTSDKFCSPVSPGWLQVDLGLAQNIGSFTVRHAGAGGESATWNTRAFTIQISTNGSTWTTPVSVTANTANVSTHPIATQSARYVRLNVTTATQTTATPTRIYELEVYPGTAAGCALATNCEAESALLGGGVVASSLHAGYTGTGFADYQGTGSGFVEWTVNIPTAATYQLFIRYANGGTGDRPMSISVNGATTLSSLSFPVTGWTNWTPVSWTASLPAGLVRIRATELPNGPNVDNLVVFSTTGARPTPPNPRITPTPSPRPRPTSTATATSTTPPVASPTPCAGPCTTTYTRNGLTLTLVDNSSNCPPAAKDRVAQTFFSGYAQERARFNTAAPASVRLTIDPNYTGVAFTAGQAVTCASNWLAAHPWDADGCGTHEFMHVTQGYNSPSNPGWAVEGLADYARYRYGLFNAQEGWALPAYSSSQHYTNAYRVTARFFVWLENRVRATILTELDDVMKAGTYTPDFWVQRTGFTVDQLWQQYGANPAL